MATYAQALPALTTSLFRLKWGSHGSDAVAFSDPEVARVSVTTRPDARRAASYTSEAALLAWLRPTIQSFQDLLQLPQNWDGYGAVQIQERIAKEALMVLAEVMDNDAPAPSVVPLSDGGVQLEWHRCGRNLEIEFPADEAPGFYYYEDDSDLESEGQVSESYEQIQAYIANLK
jgi:hypothetical protein